MLRVGRSNIRAESASQNARDLRRPVELTGFGILRGGETFALSVLDLSYDGCRIKCELALLPGTNLRISILGLGRAAEAIVRWFKDGSGGIEFYPEDDEEVHQKPRVFERAALRARLSLRRQGRQGYVANLFDLSPKGCRVDFIEKPKCGERMWAKIDGLESIEATVRWVDGFQGGLEFVRPIYPAVFDILLEKLSQEINAGHL